MKNMHVQAAIIILLFSSIAISGNYYVDEFGSDTTGDGSSGNPWATVGYAVNQISDTEIFIYCSGTIDETSNGGVVVIPDSLYAPITIDGLGSSIWRVQCDARSLPATIADTVSICNFAELSPTASGPSEYAIRIGYMTQIHDIDWIHGYTYGIFLEELTSPPPPSWLYYGAYIYDIGDPGTTGNNGFMQNDYGVWCLSGFDTDINITNSNLHDNVCGVAGWIQGCFHVTTSHIWQNAGGISIGGNQLDATSNYIYENTGNAIECINSIYMGLNSNIIHDNGGQGVYWWYYIDQSPHGVYTNLSVINNELYSNGSDGLNILNEGIHAFLLFQISDNSIYGNASNGIVLISPFNQSDANEIMNNTVTDNNSTGIRVEMQYSAGGTPKLDLSGNTVLSNASHGLYMNVDEAGWIRFGTASEPGNNELHDNDVSGAGIDFYNNSTMDISAIGNDWGDTTNALMTDHFYNETDIPAIYDFWEDPSTGYVIWSESCPIITEPTSSTIWNYYTTGHQVLWNNSDNSEEIQYDQSPLVGDSVIIELYKNSIFVAELSPLTPNTGSWTMTISVPDIWIVGSDYQVKVSDNMSTFSWSEEFTVAPPVPIAEEGQTSSYEFNLHDISPNPVLGVSTIHFETAELGGERVHMVLYDISGRIVTELVDDVLEPGPHEVMVDNLCPGLYIVRMQAGEHEFSKQMIVLR